MNVLGNRLRVEDAKQVNKRGLGTVCGLNGDETALNFSERDLSPGEAMLIANDIRNCSRLKRLDISKNGIGRLVVPDGWHYPAAHGNGVWVHTDGRRQEERPGIPEGLIALVESLKNHKALEKLNLSEIWADTKEAGQALADLLKENSVLRELDISNNFEENDSSSSDGSGFARALTVGLGANGALTSLNLSRNGLGAEGAKHVAEAIKVNVSVLQYARHHFELDLISIYPRLY